MILTSSPHPQSSIHPQFRCIAFNKLPVIYLYIAYFISMLIMSIFKCKEWLREAGIKVLTHYIIQIFLFAANIFIKEILTENEMFSQKTCYPNAKFDCCTTNRKSFQQVSTTPLEEPKG